MNCENARKTLGMKVVASYLHLNKPNKFSMCNLV